MRILVLRGGALGDFIVTLPALDLLRARWPEARIELVGHAAAGELGVLGGQLDAVHSQHAARWSAPFRDGPLPSDLAAWLAEFDLVLNYWPDPDGTLARRFPLRPGQEYLSAPPQPTLAPAARHFCEPLRALGLSTTDFRSRLQLPVTNDLGPSTLDLRPMVALHPGSGSPRKNWPPERWLELIQQLEPPILLVLGEAEHEWLATCRSLFAGDQPASRTAIGSPASRLLHPRVHLAHNLPLPELAAALSRCRLFLGHDSGVSHLAAAVGTPCVLLFGPTDPAMWAPPGDHVRVLRRGATLDSISVEEVLASMPRT
jgi:heptosyltransferase-2